MATSHLIKRFWNRAGILVAIMMESYHLLGSFNALDTELFMHWLILPLQQYYKASSTINIIMTKMRHEGICDMRCS